MTDLLDELDALTATRDTLVMEWGWKANEYIAERELQAANVKHPHKPYRDALTDALDELSERYAAYMCRKTLTDRVKVTRFFTRDKYAELPGHPTYNHLRACFAMGEWPNANEAETWANVTFAIENDWPAPDVIRHRGQKTDENPNERQFRVLREAAQRVANNPEQSKRRREAAEAVLKVESNQ